MGTAISTRRCLEGNKKFDRLYWQRWHQPGLRKTMTTENLNQCSWPQVSPMRHRLINLLSIQGGHSPTFPSDMAKEDGRKGRTSQKMKPRATENPELRVLRQQVCGPSRNFFFVTIPTLTNDSVYLLENQNTAIKGSYSI